MTKWIAVLTLSVFVALGALPDIASAARAGQDQQTATIEGAAHDSSGKPLAKRPVQARNVQTGQIAASANTDAYGRFRFGDLPRATYIVELLNDARRTVGTSIEIPLTTVPVAFVTVCAASTDKVPKSTWWKTTPAVLGAAAAVGITAAVVSTRDEASPVR